MNVLNPNNTNHALKIVPRFYPDGEVSVVLKDEETAIETTLAVDPDISNGYMYLTFSHEFKDNSNYQVAVSKDNDIVYRGKIFATSQYADTQDYKISNDVFIYE